MPGGPGKELLWTINGPGMDNIKETEMAAVKLV
jgi:hypothetical protein